MDCVTCPYGLVCSMSVHFFQGSRLLGPERWWDLPTCTPGLGPRQQAESRWGGCWNLGEAASYSCVFFLKSEAAELEEGALRRQEKGIK